MTTATCVACGATIAQPLVRIRVPLPRAMRSCSTDPAMVHDVTVHPCAGCDSLHFRNGPDIDLVIDSLDLPSLRTRTAERAWRRQATTLIKHLPRARSPTVLGVGTGDGGALVPYRDLGATVVAVEAARARAALSRTSGICTMTARFGTDVARDLVADGMRVDLVLTGTTLCRTPDPHDLVEGVRLVLQEDGVAVVALPHVPAVHDLTAPGLLHPEWGQLLTPEGLRALATSHGLRPVAFHDLDSTVHHQRVYLLVHGNPTQSDEEPLANRVAPTTSLDEGLANWCDAVRELLVTRRARGRALMGVGLGAEACAMLELAQIGPDLVEAIVDLNPFKIGRFTAGAAIPVVDVKATQVDPPPDLIVLAPAIGSEVRRQHSALRARGGRVIDLTRPLTGSAAGSASGNS